MSGQSPFRVARVYLRVSTDRQDLDRQERLIEGARAAGYYVAGVYREKASGARADRPELLRMRSEEHTSELQSRGHLVCRLLLEKKKLNKKHTLRPKIGPLGDGIRPADGAVGERESTLRALLATIRLLIVN